MAFSFSSGQYLGANFVPNITAFPVTLFARGSHNSTATTGALISLSNFTGYNSIAVYFRGDLTGDPIAGRRIRQLGTGDNNPQSAAYTASQNYSICLVCTAANDAAIFVDGVKTTTSASVDFPAITPNNIGVSELRENSGHDATRVGLGQNFAVWSAALTDSEVNSLTKGFSPLRIRPQSLEFYLPAMRNTREYLSGINLSYGVDPPVTDHLRTYGI